MRKRGTAAYLEQRRNGVHHPAVDEQLRLVDAWQLLLEDKAHCSKKLRTLLPSRCNSDSFWISETVHRATNRESITILPRAP